MSEHGALARASALIAGDPEWWTVTEWPRCSPKTGWITGETYCAHHGRDTGWPCLADTLADTTTEER